VRIPGFIKRAVLGVAEVLQGLPLKVHFHNQTGHRLKAHVSLKAEGNAVGVWITVYEPREAGFNRQGTEATESTEAEKEVEDQAKT